MRPSVHQLLSENNLTPESLIYILCDHGKAILYPAAGSPVVTTIPLKDILAEMPRGMFLNISKGVALYARRIAAITDDGIYTMDDGRCFTGRRRTLKAHRDIRKALGLEPKPDLLATLVSQCAIFDNLPMAACLLELVTDPQGALINFVYRYCNGEMEKHLRLPKEKLIGHSMRELFVFDSAEHLNYFVAFADVAINGSNRICQSITPYGEPINLCLYRPAPGYCVCTSIKLSDIS